MPMKYTLIKLPNNACSRRVGVAAFFKPFSGFEFFPLPILVHPPPRRR